MVARDRIELSTLRFSDFHVAAESHRLMINGPPFSDREQFHSDVRAAPANSPIEYWSYFL
jgi:hypothetical protein